MTSQTGFTYINTKREKKKEEKIKNKKIKCTVRGGAKGAEAYKG
jgi:hypothetical protein